jgi:hypothetical protein
MCDDENHCTICNSLCDDSGLCDFHKWDDQPLQYYYTSEDAE